ncbi:flagellar biosynthetic protein FliR [Allopseudospirillum japonicum]|uniref:Flagellar biosynthetic protein FliR n=1 Tax=Allopseudospirillum japonicum TaxID=64971 RepID=A0A1H6QV66_9GAMM|nr:flagellar biosynthetic protein FliR [Allopseudospirillum japonicum]SEI45946.1 flagellar biosynthetic protein FliR [Allopseudospirillum japonicum]
MILPPDLLPLDDKAIGAWVGSFLWPFFRIAGFFLVAPILSSQTLPQRIRLGLAVAFTIALMPALPAMPQMQALTLNTWVLIAQQILIGISLGTLLQFLFQIFVLLGQMVAMQMGLGFASMADPVNGINVTVLSQFFLISINLLFLAMNGHLVMFDTLAESFRILPIGETAPLRESTWLLVQQGTWLFVASLLMALPAITALLIINAAFGVMTRAAPQLNIFSLGFPVSMLGGLVAVWVLAHELLPHFDQLSRQAFGLMRQWLGVP